ncbi:MAG: nucleoside-diphosphate kinase, partial [Candidatus Aenigmarchaeota archaeon]|nr:nucleoside-diphosphate kinase [Candidatus Aenigmarchaeota archaeon]
MLEKTFIMVKHDGVQRGLVGEIISRFEKVGLKLIALKMLTPTEDLADRHYVLTEAWVEKLGTNTRKAFEKKGINIKETNEQIAKRVHGWLKGYLREGPVVAMAFEGYHAIEIGRKIVGPAEAKSAPLGTIRGDFTVDSYDMAD